MVQVWKAGTPKPKRTRKSKKPQPAKPLLEALKFLKPCHKKSGSVPERFCFLSGHWAAMRNEFLTIGTKIIEDVEACPQYSQFEEALKKVGEEMSITVSQQHLCIASDALKMTIPCVNSQELTIGAPDAPIAEIDHRISDALNVLLALPDPKAGEAKYAAILLQSGSAVASDGRALIEYWHGIDLPPNILIPHAAAKAIVKSKKTLTQFGYSGPSATFWFEDGSFIKTQLYAEQFPEYQSLFNLQLFPWELPSEFFQAVRILHKFAAKGIVWFEEGRIASDDMPEEASTYVIEGLPEGMKFHTEFLIKLDAGFNQVYFDIEDNNAYFFGENIRGIVRGIENAD